MLDGGGEGQSNQAEARHFNLDGEMRVCASEDSGPSRVRGRPFGKILDSQGFELVRGGFRDPGCRLGDLPIKGPKITQREARAKARDFKFSQHASVPGVVDIDVSSSVIAAPVAGDLPVGLPGAIGGRVEPGVAAKHSCSDAASLTLSRVEAELDRREKAFVALALADHVAKAHAYLYYSYHLCPYFCCDYY